MNLFKKALTPFGKYLSNLVPQRHRARYDEIGQNVGLASTLTVDSIHAAVRSAESGNTQRLFAIFSEMLSTDNYLQSLLDGRKRAALKQKPLFIPVDTKNEADVTAAEMSNRMFLGYAPDDDELDDWQLALGALMDATLWPKTLLSKRFARSSQPGMRYDLAGLRFVDYQLFDWTQRQFMLAEVEPGFGARTGTFQIRRALAGSQNFTDWREVFAE